MAEALALFGAIAAGISLLQIAKHVVTHASAGSSTYQSYGTTLITFKHDIDVVEELLEDWKSEWEIGNLEQGGEGVRYFGPRGWRQIQEELTLIDALCFCIVGLLAPLLPPEQTHAANTRAGTTIVNTPRSRKLQKRSPVPVAVLRGREVMGRLSEERLQALLQHRRNAELVNKFPTTVDRIMFVLDSSGGEIASKIEELEDRYEKLERMSKRKFEKMYEELSVSMPQAERRLFVGQEWDVHYALRFRANAISMVSALGSNVVEPKDLALELDARRNPRTGPEVVDYRLIAEPLVIDGSYALSIQAFGPEAPGSENPFPTFSGAYRRARNGHSVVLRVRKSGASNLYYSITGSRLPSSVSAQRLAESLRNRTSLSFRERRELMYLLADCCLLILNTSWMSAFSSESLIIRCDDQGSACYSLGFRDEDRARCELLEQLSESSQPQAYSIGILLIELAVQRKVTAFDESEDPRVLTFDDDTEMDLDEAILDTKRTFGEPFMDVVAHCFYETQLAVPPRNAARREEVELDMLHDFHEHVFLPLKKLREGRKKRNYSIPRALS